MADLGPATETPPRPQWVLRMVALPLRPPRPPPPRSPMAVSLLPLSPAGVPRSGAPLERGHQRHWWLEGPPSGTHPARPSVHTWAGADDAWPPAGHARRLPQPPEAYVTSPPSSGNWQGHQPERAEGHGGPLPISVWWPDGKVAGGGAPLVGGGGAPEGGREGAQALAGGAFREW